MMAHRRKAGKARSDVIEQHQLVGVRLQVHLIAQIVHPLPPHMVADEGQGNHERHQTLAVALDRLHQLGPVLAVEAVRDEAQEMLEDVGVATARGGAAVCT